MKPIYELVNWENLNVGDIVRFGTGDESEFIVDEQTVEVYRRRPIMKIFRRLPATEDPRVLRRVAELLAGWYANETDSDAKKELDGAIEQAVMEFESESAS